MEEPKQGLRLDFSNQELLTMLAAETLQRRLLVAEVVRLRQRIAEIEAADGPTVPGD